MYPTHVGPIGHIMLALWSHKYKLGHIDLILIIHHIHLKTWIFQCVTVTKTIKFSIKARNKLTRQHSSCMSIQRYPTLGGWFTHHGWYSPTLGVIDQPSETLTHPTLGRDWSTSWDTYPLTPCGILSPLSGSDWPTHWDTYSPTPPQCHIWYKKMLGTIWSLRQ